MSNQSQIEAPPNVVEAPDEFSADILQETVEQDTTPSEPSEKPKTVTYRQLLSNSNFRLLWLGQGITTFGSFFTRVAVPIYVYNLTGSYSQLGFSFFVSIVPSLLFGLFAGAFVDRWDRRRTMIYTDLLNFALMCSLIAIIIIPAVDSIKLGAIYILMFLAGILREIFNPARIAIFTEVVKEKELLTANSLDQSTQTLGELLSYPVAAYALSRFSAEVAFGVDAASFLISAALIWGVKTQQTAVETTDAGTIWSDMIAGLAVVNQIPLLRKIVILSMVVPLIFMLYGTLQLPFAVDELGSSSEVGFPALEGALACGLTVGMLLVGRWGQHFARWKMLAVGIFSFGFVLTIIGLVPQLGEYIPAPTEAGNSVWTPLLLIAMPLTFLAGVSNSLIATSIRTVQQEAAPRAMIGRVASVVGVAAGLGWSIGALLTGIGEGRAGVVISIIGGILLAIGIFSMWWLRMPPRQN